MGTEEQPIDGVDTAKVEVWKPLFDSPPMLYPKESTKPADTVATTARQGADRIREWQKDTKAADARRQAAERWYYETGKVVASIQP